MFIYYKQNGGVQYLSHVYQLSIDSIHVFYIIFLLEVYKVTVLWWCECNLISNIRIHQWTVFVTFSYQ